MAYVFLNLNCVGIYVVGLWDSDGYNSESLETHKILNE